ncbi:hypothetical protein ACFQUU_13095 [Herbaspirillum sp. GCM10030257]
MQMGKVTQQKLAIAEEAAVAAGPLPDQSGDVAEKAAAQGTLRV